MSPLAVLPYPILRRVSSPSGGSAAPPQPLVQCAAGVRQRVPVRCSRERTPEGQKCRLELLSAPYPAVMPFPVAMHPDMLR